MKSACEGGAGRWIFQAATRHTNAGSLLLELTA